MLQLKPYLRRLFNQTDADLGVRFLFLGGVLGLCSGMMALGFHYVIVKTSELLFSVEMNAPFWEVMHQIPAMRLFVTMIVVALVVTYVTRFYAAEAQGHGVPEIMIAVATKNSRIRARVALVKFLGSSLSIGSGFSVGREGPTALIGATMGSVLGHFLNLSRKRMKMIVGCGTAGALAATFNAPLAGAAFALELVVGNFSLNYFGPIFLAAVMGTFTSRFFHGNQHALFSDISFGVRNPLEFFLVVLLGLFAGAFGVIFTKTLYGCEDLAARAKYPQVVKIISISLLVALMIYFIPFLAGPAHWDAIRFLTSHKPTWAVVGLAMMLAVTKLFATSLSLSSGASGGIFAPSLFMGSCLGTAYGVIVHKIFGTDLHSPASYSMVAMGAFVAAITQAPLTAITIVFELTNQYEIILPLVVALGAAMAVHNHFIQGSIYTLKLLRRGVNLQWGRDVGVLQSLLVKDIAEKEPITIDSEDSYEQVLEKMRQSSRTTLPVVDEASRELVGVLSTSDLEAFKQKLVKEPHMNARQMAHKDPVFITAQENLYEAFCRISAHDFSYLPVVSGEGQKILVGGLHRHRLLQAYRNALEFRGVMDTP